MNENYIFTPEDVEELKKIGYTLVSSSSSSTETLDVFINTFFQNLNILTLLQKVEQYFTPATTASIVRNIYFDFSIKELVLECYNDIDHTNSDLSLVFVRKFLKISRSIIIEHSYCILPLLSRGQGHIKPVFMESLEQYLNCGAKKIIVHAALSGGGYTWARHGFRATNQIEMAAILSKARIALNPSEYAICKRIYDGYYIRYPRGRSFPINFWAALDFMKPVLLGSDWHGELDLKNKNYVNKFKEYVQR